MSDPARPVIVRAGELLRLRRTRSASLVLLVLASALASAAASRAYTQRQYLGELRQIHLEQEALADRLQILQADYERLAASYAAEARRMQSHGDLLVTWGDYVRDRLDVSRQNREARVRR